MRSIPTREEINPIDEDLDGQTALVHFYGKSQGEAAKLFFGGYSTYYEEDLLWMGGKAFVFYFPSLEPYLQSEESADDSDIINAMMGTLSQRIKYDPQSIRECRESILRVLAFVSENWAKFNVDPVIYGDLAGVLREVREKVQAMEAAGS